MALQSRERYHATQSNNMITFFFPDQMDTQMTEQRKRTQNKNRKKKVDKTN